MTTKISLERLNTLDQSDFAAVLGGIFEGPPWIVSEAWQSRPFSDVDALTHQGIVLSFELINTFLS